MQTTASKELGQLPLWDLSDFYDGPDSPALQQDLKAVAADVAAFETSYKGTIAGADGASGGDSLARAIADYEALQDRIGRIGCYAQLLYAGNMADAAISKFQQTIREKLSDITTGLIFFTLEINRLEDEALNAMLAASPALAHYAPWLRDVRAYRPHELSDEMEKLLHEKAVTGRAAWNRLFDETVASLSFQVGEETLNLEQALHRLSEPDEAERKRAAKAIGEVLGQNSRQFALIMNTLIKDKETEDRWRKYERPESYRHLANQVEGEVVDALRTAVIDAYPRLSHRYYAMKAKWFGKEALEYWDRNAPLPGADEKIYRFEEARDIVLDAYGRFSPDLADLGRRFFDNAWIDAPVRPGKSPGAFAHPTVPSAHPYLLLNYMGRTRDVMTLAHELGHGVHQLLAAPQGALMAGTPLTLAETASVFGEQLTFRGLLARESDPARRKYMLASKVEDMINTVVRQTAFYDFELRLHSERREGELTAERIGEIWLAVQGESLGPAIRFEDEYRHYWSYISHFIHVPFYVYAYAFGDCLVNSLYAVYQQAEEGFQAKYFEMLKAGGTLRHKELLAPFGLDASDPNFWQKGLGVIESFIDELEELE